MTHPASYILIEVGDEDNVKLEVYGDEVDKGDVLDTLIWAACAVAKEEKVSLVALQTALRLQHEEGIS